ncbi:3prime(2prime) [Diplonema papillatum]|nr:3prime(2prime) [Diplonema papillatum]|eukprot:gene15775-24095_t
MDSVKDELSVRVAKVIDIARQAGAIAMRYANKKVAVETKSDESPVTEADKAVNEFIVASLQRAFPHEAIVAEEDEDGTGGRSVRNPHGNVWYVDPIDGTREFIKKTNMWAVMIGLCRDQKPVLGVIFQATTQTLYYAYAGGGAYKVSVDSMEVRMAASQKDSGFTCVRSARYPVDGDLYFLESFARTRPGCKVITVGSFGLKLVALADGQAEMFVSVSYGSLWDTCAGQVIAEEAGVSVSKVDLRTKTILPLTYDPTRPLALDFPVIVFPKRLMPAFKRYISPSFTSKL